VFALYPIQFIEAGIGMPDLEVSDYEYFADAVAMAWADELDSKTILASLTLADTAQDFNAAIWAAIALRDITHTSRGADRSDRQ